MLDFVMRFAAKIASRPAAAVLNGMLNGVARLMVATPGHWLCCRPPAWTAKVGQRWTRSMWPRGTCSTCGGVLGSGRWRGLSATSSSHDVVATTPHSSREIRMCRVLSATERVWPGSSCARWGQSVGELESDDAADETDEK